MLKSSKRSTWLVPLLFLLFLIAIGSLFALVPGHSLFLIDYYNDTSGQLTPELVRRGSLFVDHARERGASIFHLCYGCFVPADARNDDAPLREAAAALPHCTTSPPSSSSPVRPSPQARQEGRARFSSDERVHVQPWPFRQPPSRGGTPLLRGCELMANGTLSFRLQQPQECPKKDRPPSDNSVRLRPENPHAPHPGISIHPQDVVTDMTDWAFRVLHHRRISSILFFGVDANECVLYARDLSILSMLRRGWPAARLFAMPELAVSNYLVQGVEVPWDQQGAPLWAAALFQNFGVQSLCLEGEGASLRGRGVQGLYVCR